MPPCPSWTTHGSGIRCPPRYKNFRDTAQTRGTTQHITRAYVSLSLMGEPSGLGLLRSAWLNVLHCTQYNLLSITTLQQQCQCSFPTSHCPTIPSRLLTFSSSGLSMMHGPHHVANTSRIIGSSQSVISISSSSPVTSRADSPIAVLNLVLPVVCNASRRPTPTALARGNGEDGAVRSSTGNLPVLGSCEERVVECMPKSSLMAWMGLKKIVVAYDGAENSRCPRFAFSGKRKYQDKISRRHELLPPWFASFT